MPDLDDLLQQNLAALEDGRPLQDILAGLPPDADGLIPLLRLAASVRVLPQPEWTPAQLRTGQTKVLAAARELTQPASAFENRSTPAGAVTRPNRRLDWNHLRAQPRFWLGALAALFLVILLATGGLTWYLSSPRGMDMATLMDVTGQVEAASADQAADWQPVGNGAKIRTGQRIRTSNGSNATLVFYEGTRSTIGPDADLTLTTISGGQNQLLRVFIDQYAGRTANSVVPFTHKNSSFIVNTPSGSATVHGTQFDVEIDQGGQTRFAVFRGKVLVYNEQSEVFVSAGQTARTGLDDQISDPAYQFHVQGPVETIDGNTWMVQGVSFIVNDLTIVNGDFAMGSRVSVEGHLEGGARTADSINPAAGEQNSASFTGQIERIAGETWQIGGMEVVVPASTQRPADLRQGDTVRVTFQVENRRWIASRIESLTEPPVKPDPTATPDPGANPRLIFNPDEVETTGCGMDFRLDGTLANTATGTGDRAVDVQLDYLISRGGEYITGVELIPSGWTTIEPGQSGQFNLRVTTSPAYRETTGNRKQIKMRVFVAGESNQPGLTDSHLTAVIVSTCKQTETSTPAQTVTPGITATFSPTLPGSATPGAGTSCTGANPHPQGMRLAQRYGVPYEEIMAWFCQNFGFGEIDMAYSLSQQSGKTTAEIFAMRRSGLGWGEIKKQLSTTRPGNGNGNGNGPKVKPTKKPKN